MTWDWLAAIVFFASLVALTAATSRLLFRLEPAREMRDLNRASDEQKLARPRYRDAIQASQKWGLVINLGFYVAVLPWFVSLDSRPLWQHALEIVAVLLVFDFFYYWTHRSLFHGRLLRKIHSLHHQARRPTYIDAHYVHPLETSIGLCLFLFSIPAVSLALGAPLHAVSMATATLVFTQLNILNHVYTRLPARFPYNVVDRITGVHAAHHVDMNQGNYATLTMLYDKLFGTYETPVHRPAP